MALAESVVLLLTYGSGLNFFQDEWTFLLGRRGFSADAFLLPHNEHIVVIPVAVYKLLLAAFGMTTTTPFRVVSTLLLAGTGALVFAFLRRRVGDWIALFATTLVLFLGPGWHTLLWPFEIGLVGSLAAGIAMLLALERRDRTGDRRACVLLVVSVLCSSLGVAFVLAAAVDVALRRVDWRRRIYVPAIPLAIYAAWYLAYGHRATSAVSAHNIVASPVYLLNGVAASLQSLLGLLPEHTLQAAHPTWGWAVLAAIVVVALIRVRRGADVGPQVWPVVVAAAAFWLLAGANYVPGRGATESRYQYLGAVLALLVLAELFVGIRLRRAALWGGALLTALALVANLGALRDGRDYLREQSDLSRADLGAVEIARATVSPSLVLTPDVAGTQNLTSVEAGPYLSAVAAYGSPADSPPKLVAAPEVDRGWADVVLGHALPVRLDPNPAPPAPGPAPVSAGTSPPTVRTRGKCVLIAAADARHGAELRLRSDAVAVRPAPGGPVELTLRRFSNGSFPFTAGKVTGPAGALLTIPTDLSTRPWHLQVAAKQAVTVCGATAG